MELFSRILINVSDFIYVYILCGLLVACGLYFTFKTKFAQISLFSDAIKFTTEKSKKDKVSSFQALMLCTASKVGTANIAGIASAIVLGGPGAIFWIWAVAIIGAASSMAEATLAQIYKKRSKDGSFFVGGPAYYIKNALGQKWLGTTFAILLVFCFLVGFNALQAHNMSMAFETFIPNYLQTFWPWLIGGIFATLIGSVILGGVKRIGLIISYVVPIMASIYLLMGIFTTLMNIQKVPHMFSLIFQDAFNFKAISGGFAGSVLVMGIKRGLLSNEAGMGSAPNSAATADTSHPIKQGIAQILSVTIDTFLICTTSAFIILLSGVDLSGKIQDGVPLMQHAISLQVGNWGKYFVLFSLAIFAFSAILGNFGVSEPNILFIKNSPKLAKTIRIISIIPIIFGCVVGYKIVWNLAEIAMALIAIVNIISILLLSKKFMICLKDYLKQKKSGKDPVFKGKDCGFENLDYWD